MALALVTGASGGIGLALAEELAISRTNLVLTARSGAALDRISTKLATEHGIQATAISLDLSRPGAAGTLVSAMRDRGLEPDILINNAGFATYGKFAEQPLEPQLEMIRLNVMALVELTGLVLPRMVARRRGRILNVASTAAFQSGPLMSVYYASKAFVLHFSEAIANELKGTGVTVTALCPGPTESGFQRRAKIQESPLVKNELADARVVARAGLDAMYGGKAVVVPGVRNRLMAFSVRLSPRSMVTAAVRKMQEKASS
jgi:short-subunit dehydrogenase